MKKTWILLTILMLSGIVAASATTPIPTDFQQMNDGEFTFAWRIVGTNLEVILEQETTGWVAVGFEPSRVMKDASIIIGYVDGSDVVVEDHFAHRLTAHRPDTEMGGTDDVTVISGEEMNGRTQLRFRIPLDSGDQYDHPLARGESLDVIFAWGRDGADNFRAVHAGHGKTTLRL